MSSETLYDVIYHHLGLDPIVGLRFPTAVEPVES